MPLGQPTLVMFSRFLFHLILMGVKNTDGCLVQDKVSK